MVHLILERDLRRLSRQLQFTLEEENVYLVVKLRWEMMFLSARSKSSSKTKSRRIALKSKSHRFVRL